MKSKRSRPQCPEPMKRAYITKRSALAAAQITPDEVEPEFVSTFRIASSIWKLKGPPVAEVLDIRRKYLGDALAELKDGKRIDGAGIDEVIDVLEATLAGCDPRESLGIEPKNGRPQSMAEAHAILAAHYWSLRESATEKVAASIVAKLWEISTGRVRAIAKENTEKAKGWIASTACEEITIAELSALYAQHR
jgi:hypothetical protein